MHQSKIINQEQLLKLRTLHPNQKISFTAGGYDLIHVGHTRYLNNAKKQADILVVGLASNQAIKSQKGPQRPILDELTRAEMLANLMAVDYIYIHPEKFATQTILDLKPDILVMTAGNWSKTPHQNPDYQAAETIKAKVVILPRQTPNLSTSTIIEKITSQSIQKAFHKYLNPKLTEQELKA